MDDSDDESMDSIIVEELPLEGGHLRELPRRGKKKISFDNSVEFNKRRRTTTDSDNETPLVNNESLNSYPTDSESEEDDPTNCGHYNVIVLDEENNENVIHIDENELENAELIELSCDSNVESDDDPASKTLKVIMEEGFVICPSNEVEPAAVASKAIVEDVKFKGTGWNNGSHNLEVSVKMAVYPPLSKLPDKCSAFIFNGHKYYTVKGGRPGVTYYSCAQARKGGSCPVRCRVRSNGTVELTGEHDHPAISMGEELRTDFKRRLKDACLNQDKEVALKDVYRSVATEDPEGAKFLPFSQARRFMLVCRHAAHDLPLRKKPKPVERYFAPDPERQFIPGRGYFLDGFRYYKMKEGPTTTYFKCAESKRGCRASCRVKLSDGTTIASGVHNHERTDDTSLFLIDDFKSVLKAVIQQPEIKKKSIREIYQIAAEKDPVGAELYPYNIAKHFLFKRRGRVIPPRPPEVRHPPVDVRPYGKRFIHLNHKYHLVKRRAGKAMYYKCGQWKSGCQVNLRIMNDGTVVVVGTHTHEPVSEIEVVRRSLMEKLHLAVMRSGPRTTLKEIYDNILAREGLEKKSMYPWKHAWYFMERIRRKKIKDAQMSLENSNLVCDSREGEGMEDNENSVDNEQTMLDHIDYYELIDEDGNIADEKTLKKYAVPVGDNQYGYYLEDAEEEEEEEEDQEISDSAEELEVLSKEILKHSNFVVKTPQLDFDTIKFRKQDKVDQNQANSKIEVRTVSTSTSKKPRSSKKTPITIDPNVKRVVIVPVYPQNVVEEIVPEPVHEEKDDHMYHEVIVNEDGSMEPTLIFVDEVPSEATNAEQ